MNTLQLIAFGVIGLAAVILMIVALRTPPSPPPPSQTADPDKLGSDFATPENGGPE